MANFKFMDIFVLVQKFILFIFESLDMKDEKKIIKN